MQEVTTERTVQAKGVNGSAAFGLSFREEDQIKLMVILRDNLYQDKPLAVIREISSNAWDANREAGRGDMPIEVQIPTHLDPTLVIRDFGLGLPEEDVFGVYTQYGYSTKRDSNLLVGAKGLGCKAPFAYTDQFTVTSWHGGKKMIFVAALDKTDRGTMSKLHEEPCPADQTGIEVKVPIRPADIYEFERKAKGLFPFYEPVPKTNIALPLFCRTNHTHGFIANDPRMVDSATAPYRRHEGWFALMGCVPYQVDLYQLEQPLRDAGIWTVASKLTGGLFFGIGDIQITANREAVEYKDHTKAALIEKLKLVINEYKDHVLAVLQDRTVSAWEKRAAAGYLARQLSFTLDDKYKAWGASEVTIYGDGDAEPPPKTFRLRTSTNHGTNRVSIDSRLAFYVQDDDRAVTGYTVPHQGTVVIRLPGMTVAQVRKELSKYLRKAKLTGVKVSDLSTLTWHDKPKRDTSGRVINPKHSRRAFRLLKTHASGILSDNWEAVTRVPEDDDVFIIISHFACTRKGSSFWSDHATDKALCGYLGLTMPEVYGYKTTAKKQIGPADCTGTHYYEWRKRFFTAALTANVRERLNLIQWIDLLHNDYHLTRSAELIVETAAALCGPGHAVTRIFQGYTKAKALLGREARRSSEQDHLRHLLNVADLQQTETEAKRLKAELEERYPLLFHVSSLSALGSDETSRALWLNHIALVDADRRCRGVE